MHTETVIRSLTAILLLVSPGIMTAQETFPLYLPADTTPPLNIWATSGRTSIVHRRNMSKAGQAFVKTIEYYDKFGRPEETTMTAYENSDNDVAVYYGLDCFGRMAKEWMSVPSPQSAGAFISESSCTSSASTFYGDQAPYTSTAYESSPLSRVTTKTGPGTAWHLDERTTAISYLINSDFTDSLKCMSYSLDYVPSGNVLVNFEGYYASGSLLVKSETDEDGHVTLTFTDRCGRLMLVRKATGTEGERIYHDTYFIYDQRDRLCAVLPPAIPKQMGFVPLNIMAEYAYQYKYDERDRMSARRFPGTGWTYMVYDNADRVVLVQDREMHARGESVFHVYDILGRECVTGITHGNITSDMASSGISGLSICHYTGVGGLNGYEVSGIELSGPEVLTANFFDSYSFIGYQSGLGYVPDTQYDSKAGSQRGLQTGAINARMGSSGIGNYDTIAIYHDMRGRVVQRRETNSMGGLNVTSLSLGLNGEVLSRRIEHSAQGYPSLTETINKIYDGWGRLVQTTHSVNGSTPVTLSSLTYDAVGRLATKTVGGLETTAYTYNVRSWPTRLLGQRFTERLCYNSAVEGLSPVLEHEYRYDGTVSAYACHVAGETFQRGYTLMYDGLNRLTAAHYGESSSLGSYHTKYDEMAEYDCMGNPTWIYRRSPDVINDIRPSSPSDRLRLEYDGNQLVHVTDSVTSGHNYAGAFHFADGADETVEYEYDENGNMTKDLNRNISSISYNLLNLPSMISFGDNSFIKYTYSATGEKLGVEYGVRLQPVLSPTGQDATMSENGDADGTMRDRSGGLDPGPLVPVATDAVTYCGNVVYDGNDVRLMTDEGYVTFTATGTPQYHYYLRDHLGNIRVVMGQTGALEQVNHYYAFGGLMRESTNPGVQPYKFGGKELDRTSGLDAYDFGARMYFADRMQWGTMDPLCEKYYDVSPYGYCLDRPVNMFDPSGEKPGDIFASADDAAVNFGRIYNYHSIVDKGEYAGVIYRFKNIDGNYSYTYAVSGKQSSSSCKYDKVDGSVLPQGVRLEMVGTIHTHADFDDIEGNTLRHEGNAFSKDDIKANMKFHDANPAMTDYYVCTTNGHLLKHWYNKDENRWYNIKFKADKYKLPSDPNDPSHNKYTINAINAKVPFWIIRPLMDFDAYLENQEYK